MKRITLIFLFMSFICLSCDNFIKTRDYIDGFMVVEYDSCEYIMRRKGPKGFLAHKGNCRYCVQRRIFFFKNLEVKMKQLHPKDSIDLKSLYFSF